MRSRRGHLDRRAVSLDVLSTLWRDPPLDLAAQLAYYGILAMFPFAIFLLTIISYLPIRGVDTEIFLLLHQVMPSDAVQLFESTVRGLVFHRRGGLLALSLGGALLAASSGMLALMDALTRIYGEKETRSWLRRRLTAIAVTAVSTVLVLIATTALLVGPNLVRHASDWFGLAGVYDLVWRWLRWPTTLLAMTTLLAFLYWCCPPYRRPFRPITAGALVGVVAWVVVAFAFSRYVSKLGNYNRTYGALAAGIVLLVWIYLTSLIVLVGGVINAAIWKARRAPTTEHLVPPAPKG